MIAVAISACAFVAFVWLLVIGAAMTHDPRLVERDNPHADTNPEDAR